MTRAIPVAGVLLMSVGALLSCAAKGSGREPSGRIDPSARDQVSRLHRDAFVMDGHIHIINRQLAFGGDIGQRFANGQVDLPRIRQGGLDAFFFSIFASDEYYYGRFEVAQTKRLMDLALEQIEKNRDQVEIALQASDIERINKAGKMAVVLDLEGNFSLDGDLDMLRELYRRGLRAAMLPAHNSANGFADSCCAPPKWNGINDRGRAVIQEMNRLGMMINVAHGSDETILQTVDASSDPVLYSHGGSRHFVKTLRNISDEAARKLAAKGGVVGLQFGNSLHNATYYKFHWGDLPYGRRDPKLLRVYEGLTTIDAVDREAAKRIPFEPIVTPPELLMEIDQLVAVIDYWVNLVGEDHVALGSDFDGHLKPPRGMKDVSDYRQITEALVRKGYGEERIRKILGLNLLRVFRQVTQ